MSSIVYQYDVIVASASPVFEALKDKLPMCTNMAIGSKKFFDYSECESKLENLLGLISAIEFGQSGRDYVIVTQMNPLLSGEVVDPDVWDESTVYKSFIVDAEDYKKRSMQYSVVGRLRVNMSAVVALKHRPDLQQ